MDRQTYNWTDSSENKVTLHLQQIICQIWHQHTQHKYYSADTKRVMNVWAHRIKKTAAYHWYAKHHGLQHSSHKTFFFYFCATKFTQQLRQIYTVTTDISHVDKTMDRMHKKVCCCWLHSTPRVKCEMCILPIGGWCLQAKISRERGSSHAKMLISFYRK